MCVTTTGIPTCRPGAALRFTVTVADEPPSVASYAAEAYDTVTGTVTGGGTSLSIRSTRSVAVLPAVTPDGSLPKLSSSHSPSSSTVSSVAVTVNVLVLSSLPNVTLDGIPE